MGGNFRPYIRERYDFFRPSCGGPLSRPSVRPDAVKFPPLCFAPFTARDASALPGSRKTTTCIFCMWEHRERTTETMTANSEIEHCPHCGSCRNSGGAEWKEAPLTREEAAQVLGIKVRTLFNLRKAYRRSRDIETVHRGNVRFYRQHIEALMELLKWENSKKQPVGIRSEMAGHIATTSMSKGRGIVVLRGSAISRRLK